MPASPAQPRKLKRRGASGVRRDAAGTKQKKKKVAPAAGRLALAAGEAYARRAVEANEVTPRTVQRALDLTKVPLSSTRTNVIPQGQHAIHGAVCGLYVFARDVGVSSFTRQRPWLVRLLCMFCHKNQPDFPFTSVQVNVDYAARPHVDRNNLGTSLIVGLGSYTGGALWVHDDEKGDKPLTLQETLRQEPLYKKGATFSGRDVSIAGKWVEFDGNRLHFTRPFKGRRFSLVYFVCDRHAEAAETVRSELRQVGFKFKWNSVKLQKMLTVKRSERRKVALRVHKERHSMHRGIVPQLIGQDRVRYVQENPKLHGCNAFKLYEKYKRAKTMEEAAKLGSRGIDFIFDYNMGFLKVVALQSRLPRWDTEVSLPPGRALASRLPGTARRVPAASSAASRKDRQSEGDEGDGTTVKVRVKEMSEVHSGLDVPRAVLLQLQALAPTLRRVPEERWAAKAGPLADAPLSILRVLIQWASTGKLRFERKHGAILHDVFASWGEEQLAAIVDPKRAAQGT